MEKEWPGWERIEKLICGGEGGTEGGGIYQALKSTFEKENMIFEGDKSNTGVHIQKHVQERKYKNHELKITLRRLIRTFQPNLRKIVSVEFIFFFP